MSSVAASPSAPRSPTLQVRTLKPMEERRHMQPTECSEREPSRAPVPQLRHVEGSRSPRENPTQQEADYRSPPREHRSPRIERRDPPRPTQDEAGPHQDALQTDSPRQERHSHEPHRPDPPQASADSSRKGMESPRTEPLRRASPPITIKRSASSSPRPLLKRKYEDGKFHYP
ncbi:hypothetical protein BDZ89DRAFT_660061 [Hymenopellis radicata]|nr:hypothetical protein BDZ89DRAFT_660061 [Hymenopellis radicata]